MRRGRTDSGAAFALLAALACAPAGCRRAPPPFDASAVQRLLAAGDNDGAIAALRTSSEPANPVWRRLFALALLRTGAFDEAADALGSGDAGEEVDLRGDICVASVLSAQPDRGDPFAAVRPCDETGVARPDVDGARLLLRLRVHEDVPDGDVQAGVRALAAWPDETRRAPVAEQLTADFLSRAAEASDDARVGFWLEQAFTLSPSPELNARIVELWVARAERLSEADPHAAATAWERISLGQVPGLVIDEETRRRADAGVHAALAPIGEENFRIRYERKYGARDAAAGLWDDGRSLFNFPPAPEGGHGEIVTAWAYGIFERVRPEPSPDLLAASGLCADAAAPCAIPFQVVAGWIWSLNDIEAEFARRSGVSLVYP